MNTKKTFHAAILISGLVSLVCAFCAAWIVPPGVTSAINDLSARYAYLFPRKTILVQKIVAAAIDDSSLQMVPSRWPFKRSVYATAITNAAALGARAIVFDLQFRGHSEDPQDDRLFAQTIASSQARIVLANGIDQKKRVLTNPETEIAEGALLGFLNTPQDQDGKVRRLRSSAVTIDNQTHYSFAVQTVSALTRNDPARIVSRLPLLEEKTFLLDFTIIPGDGRVKEISFYDLLAPPQQVRERFGQDFLKDALLVIYPEAQIIHDHFNTPVGTMPGGFLHINGIASILREDVPRQDSVVPFVCCLAAFAVLAFACVATGFVRAAALGLGVAFAGFWLQVILRLNRVHIDLAPLIIFETLFLSLFFIWKYAYFLSRLLQIKSKMTLDPVKGVFTPRYFFYRLDLERDNVRLGTACQLFLLRINGLESAIKDLDVDSQKNLWLKVREIVFLPKSFWASFSPEELAGCVVLSSRRAVQELAALQCSLSAVLKEEGITATVKAGVAEFRRDYQMREMLFLLFNELKSSTRDVTVFAADAFKKSGTVEPGQKREESRFLESLDEDVDDKNRQLLGLIANLTREYAKSKEVFFQVIASLVNALEARDPYTQGHSQHVCNYAVALAEKVGWNKEEIEKLRKAALLHDLGKVGIPDGVLHKKDKLTDGEFEFIKQHEIISVKILEPIQELKEILPWILHHHEWWNGQGYPHGLAGDAIPMGSQILALADVFDALITGRDYKKAFSFDEAAAELERGKGTHFNPHLCDVFVSLLKETRTP